MFLKLLTFTKTTAMRFKLKNLFLIIALIISSGAVYGAHDDEPNKKEKSGESKDLETHSEAPNSNLKAGESDVQSNAAVGLAALAGAKEAIFYSNGDIYVSTQTEAGKENESSMLIMGSAEFANMAQIYQKGITSLTGDFLSSKNVAPAAVTAIGALKPLFIDSEESGGTVRFIGKNNKQEIKRVGYRYKDGNNATQVATIGSDDKLTSTSYTINFPRLEVRKENFNTIGELDTYIANNAGYNVNEMGYVSVATNAAVKVEELDIVNGNRFSVDAKTAARELGLQSSTKPNATDAANWYKLHIGYADIRNMVGDANALPGHSEVALDLYDYDASKNDMAADGGLEDNSAKFLNSNSYNIGQSGGKDVYATYLRSFSSPFESLRADYMFYHVLTKPIQGSVTDHEYNGPIGDPKTQFEKEEVTFMQWMCRQIIFKT